MAAGNSCVPFSKHSFVWAVSRSQRRPFTLGDVSQEHADSQREFGRTAASRGFLQDPRLTRAMDAAKDFLDSTAERADLNQHLAIPP